MARCDQQTRRTKGEEANQASLLSVENSHNSNSKKIIKVKDRWVKVRDTILRTLELRGFVMLDAIFPRVKLKRKTSPQKFVAANGEQIRC